MTTDQPNHTDETVPSSRIAEANIRPGPRLSGPQTALVLFALIIVTITIVVGGVALKGPVTDAPLPVTAQIDRRSVPVPDGSGAVITEVIVVANQSDDPIPKLDVAINGQYFLYRDSPLGPRQEIVMPQTIFSTKSNLRFVPGRYPIETITVTGRLPSGARGVLEVEP